MSCTKKQLSAFSNILSRVREQSNHVLWKVDDLYYLTDGNILLVLDESPAELAAPIEENGGYFHDFFEKELSGDHALLSAPPTVDDLKKSVRDWKEEHKHPTLATPDRPRFTLHGQYTAVFDTRLLLDALTAVGSKASCYLGRRNFSSPATLIVCRDWTTYPQALVLPLRK